MKSTTSLTTALLAAGLLTFNRAQAQTRPAIQIQKSSLTQAQADQIKSILADAKPETYSFSYAKDGKEISRAGSASMRELSTVKAYSRLGSGDTKSAGNEVLTTVGSYVKTVWTSKFGQMYPEKVRQINAILEKSAVRQ